MATKAATKKPKKKAAKKKDMRALVEELFASLDNQTRAEEIMDEIYDANVYFQDPIQRVDGLENFKRMNDQVTGKVSGVNFKMIGLTGDDRAICAEWVMNFKALGRHIALPGVSWLSFNDAGRCYRHVDYWDWMGLSDQVVPGLKVMHDLLRKAAA